MPLQICIKTSAQGIPNEILTGNVPGTDASKCETHALAAFRKPSHEAPEKSFDFELI